MVILEFFTPSIRRASSLTLFANSNSDSSHGGSLNSHVK
ncbi:hypothetical protein OROGR_019957 [Orobanche gracilis]